MEGSVHPKSIVILDCGGQYAHLIASRIRRFGVFTEIREAETLAEDLKDAAGIILSGGPQSVNDEGSPQSDPKIFEKFAIFNRYDSVLTQIVHLISILFLTDCLKVRLSV